MVEGSRRGVVACVEWQMVEMVEFFRKRRRQGHCNSSEVVKNEHCFIISAVKCMTRVPKAKPAEPFFMRKGSREDPRHPLM